MIGYESGKCTLAVQGGILGGHMSAPVSHKHMLSQPSFSCPLINEDLPAGPQLVFTLNNRFFRHQTCYILLPAKTGGQADRVISLCKYKVVGPYPTWPLPAVHDLTRDGRLSTYDVSVLKLSNVSFRGKCARRETP